MALQHGAHEHKKWKNVCLQNAVLETYASHNMDSPRYIYVYPKRSKNKKQDFLRNLANAFYDFFDIEIAVTKKTSGDSLYEEMFQEKDPTSATDKIKIKCCRIISQIL